jgi:hypothetical protein
VIMLVCGQGIAVIDESPGVGIRKYDLTLF